MRMPCGVTRISAASPTVAVTNRDGYHLTPLRFAGRDAVRAVAAPATHFRIGPGLVGARGPSPSRAYRRGRATTPDQKCDPGATAPVLAPGESSDAETPGRPKSVWGDDREIPIEM